MASAEIVVQVYAKVQYRPADQIQSESGLGMTQWARGFQRMPVQPAAGSPGSGALSGLPRTRRLRIAYISIANAQETHTAGKGPDAQTGAITTQSQADAKRHEEWHIEVARGAAAKANELEDILIARCMMERSLNACDSASSWDTASARVEELVLGRYNQLRAKYNAKLHEISCAAVIDGVWRDHQSEDVSAAVTKLLTELRSEPPHDGLDSLPDSQDQGPQGSSRGANTPLAARAEIF